MTVVTPPKVRDDRVTMWVIYDSPSDYPGLFVVRRLFVSAGVVELESRCETAPTLAEARKIVPPGLVNIGRMQRDDPAIVEVWL